MIRDAEHVDVGILSEMGAKFFEHSGYADIVEYDIDSVRLTMTNLINDDNGILLVDDEYRGMIGALIYPFYFNTKHMTGQELFWWVEPEHRKSTVGISLLHETEKKAIEKGAASFSMIALESLSPDVVGGIYMKSGYRKSEHSYIRKL